MSEVHQLTFPVSKVDAFDVLNGDVAAIKKGINHAIITEDTGEILSWVSEDYELIKNADIIKAFIDFFGERGLKVELKCWAYDNVRFKMAFSLVDHMEPINPKDLVFPVFYILNSYNRTQRYLFGMSVLREVCGNGLTAWVTENVVNMLHTPGAGIAVEESVKLIQDFLPAFEETLDPYHELAGRTLTVDAMEARIQEVIEETKFPVKLGEEAFARAHHELKKYGFDPSDWLVYNSLNYQLNHNADNLLGRKADKIDHQVLDYLMNY